VALDFDGVDDEVSHGDIAAIDGAAAFTMMGWFFIDTLENLGFLMGKDGACRLLMTTGPGTTMTVATTAVITGDSAGAAVAGVWAHWAYVFDGAGVGNAARLKLYKNAGEQTLAFAGVVGATLPDAGAEPFRVARNVSNAIFTDEKVALLKLWTAALSAAEVAQEMHSYRPARTANLLLWAPYDDGIAARDYSQQGNNGTVTGAAQTQGPPVSYGG
jgi:hypothetical protein